MSQDSPSAKLTKTGRKYQKFNERKQKWENTKEHGKKYEEMEETYLSTDHEKQTKL